MKITIIGTGYIGLTEGVCFADLGHDVVCYDIIKEKIEQLNKGIPSLYEDGLEKILKKNLKSKKIVFTTDLKLALKGTDVVFICVNTPENPKDGSADLTAIMESTKSVVQTIDTKKQFVLVIRSTVPVGTNKLVKNHMLKVNSKLNFLTASNPEFSKQGTAIKDFLNPDRIIVGVDDNKTKKIMSDVYKPLTSKGCPILFTNIETSELIKYASNTFLNVKISFINEIADVCEKTGANIEEISKAMGMDKRISPYFLNAGPGIGGSCFPKDSIALSNIGKQLGLDLHMITASVESNINRKNNLINKVLQIDKELKNKTVSLLGLTFKANTDDTRYSPALNLIEGLSNNNIKVHTYDPYGTPKAKQMLSEKALKNVVFYENPYEAIKNTELLIIITEWEEFKKLDYSKIYKMLNKKIIIDFRNILNQKNIEKIGFKYYCIGKKI